MTLLCRNQTIDLPLRLIDWFLFAGNISHGWLKAGNSLSLITFCHLCNFWQGGSNCFEIVYSFNYAILVADIRKVSKINREIFSDLQWNCRFHCVKSVQIRSFFCSVICIRTEYRPEKTPYLDTFHAGLMACDKSAKKFRTCRIAMMSCFWKMLNYKRASFSNACSFGN